MDYAALLKKLKRESPSYIRYRGAPEDGEMGLPASISPPPEGEVVVEELPRTEIDVEADLRRSAKLNAKKPKKFTPPKAAQPAADETASHPGNVADVMSGDNPVHSIEGAARQQQLNAQLTEDELLGRPQPAQASVRKPVRMPIRKRK